MLRRRLIGAVAVIVLLPTAAVADPLITPDENNPGVGVIITTPGSGGGTRPGGGGAAPVAGGGGGASGPVKDPYAVWDDICNENSGVTPACIDRPEADPADEPEDDEPDVVNVAQVAAQLRNRLNLPRLQMQTSPQAPVKALVGLQTWLWVPSGQFQPIKLSSRLGATTVTVTATPTSTNWNMGEGTKSCAGPGRPWRKGLGQSARTSCGYTYSHTSVRQPGGKYQVSATMRFEIAYTCAGNCSVPAGTLDPLDTLADNAALQVSERQSVVLR